ncbi:MAG: hypothetical protein WCK10_02730 [Candidatus Staskawiczbacteria bacterium]
MKCHRCPGEIEINITMGILIGGKVHEKVHHCKVCMLLHFPDGKPVEHKGKKVYRGSESRLEFKE